MGKGVRSGEGTHLITSFWNPESYLDDCQAPLALTQFSSGWLLSESGLASDEASGFRDHYRESELLYLLCFLSWVLGVVAVFLVAVAKVETTRDALDIMGTFLEVVDGTVTFTRDAFIIVAPLEDVVDLVT